MGLLDGLGRVFGRIGTVLGTVVAAAGVGGELRQADRWAASALALQRPASLFGLGAGTRQTQGVDGHPSCARVCHGLGGHNGLRPCQEMNGGRVAHHTFTLNQLAHAHKCARRVKHAIHIGCQTFERLRQQLLAFDGGSSGTQHQPVGGGRVGHDGVTHVVFGLGHHGLGGLNQRIQPVFGQSTVHQNHITEHRVGHEHHVQLGIEPGHGAGQLHGVGINTPKSLEKCPAQTAGRGRILVRCAGQHLPGAQPAITQPHRTRLGGLTFRWIGVVSRRGQRHERQVVVHDGVFGGVHPRRAAGVVRVQRLALFPVFVKQAVGVVAQFMRNHLAQCIN